MDADQHCTLCDLPVGSATGVVDDAGLAFCCSGCREVYHTIDVLEDDRADAIDRETVESALETTDDDVPDHYTTTFLHVDGMHCATCELFIESVGASHPDIAAVDSSYVTETVRISHDPDRVTEADLIDRLSGMGYRAYNRDDTAALERVEEMNMIRLGTGLILGLFVMFGYMMLIYPTYFDSGLYYGEAGVEILIEGLYDGAAWYLFVGLGILTSGVLFYTGAPILRGAWVSLRMRAPNMDLLIALAALSAYAYSWVEIYVGGTHIYFDVSVAIILIVTVGGRYEANIKRNALRSLTNLTRTRVDEALRLDDDGEPSTVAIDALSPGDRVLIREGDRIPIDGTVAEGAGLVDESIITGESLPVEKRPGSVVVGGSVLSDGSLVIVVDENVQNSLDRITNLLWDIQSSRAGIQQLADKLATIFVPLVVVIAVMVTTWYLLARGVDVAAALLVGLTVLIVSCPCALGLATPLSIAAGVRDALKRGIVVFDETVFERLRDVEVVVFDKTGTLTTGAMTVYDQAGPADLFEQAAALEHHSAHPIAEAIVNHFGQPHHGSADPDARSSPIADGGTSVSVTAVETYQQGVSGTVEGQPMLVGHPDLFANEGWDVPDDLADRATAIDADGNVPVLVGRGGRALGIIAVGDELREEWQAVVTDLADRGISVVLLTGGSEHAVRAFRDHPAIEHVFAEVPPEGKVETIERFRAQGPTVMVGDGTNDAPALAAADLGIALGSGTALAADAADITIVDDDLRSVTEAFELARAAGWRLKQNIGWAFLYNAIAIPLAITGLLNPLLAALAMGTSSFFVVTNSTRSLLSGE